MHERAHRAALSLVPSLLAMILVAACAGSSASSPAGSIAPTSSEAAATPDLAPAQPTIAAGCLGLELVDCTKAFDVALTARTAGAPAVYAQVGPFGCPVDPTCPMTLTARAEGDVTFDLADGTQASIHIKAGPDGSIVPTPGETFGIPVQPQSGPAGPGPMAFSLGHCGLFSGFDVDGSYWDPVGTVDPDHPDAINSSEGTFTFTGPNQAMYVSKGGWRTQLIRHEGPKLLPGCM